MDLDPTALRQKVILEKLLRNQPTLLDRAKAINFSGVKPAVSRFAGRLGNYLPKSLPSWSKNLPAVGKNIPYLNAALGTGMGLYNLSEGQNPVDAFGRPLFQVGGGILGAGTGFLADSPFSPAADIALGYAGWEGGGRLYDALRGLNNADTTRQGIRVIDDGSETGVPVTEGVGTKLIRTADGQVIRVPVETSVEGSETMSTNGTLSDVVTAEEGTNASDMVDDFLSRREWEHKSRNSPARRSGAFTDDQLWELQQRHREWKADRGR